MKINHLRIVVAVLSASMLFAGCSSKVAETDEYSGFLPDYSKLERTEIASGHEVLRWIAPGFKESAYRGIYISPLVYYPAAKPNQRVSQDTLNKIKDYANLRLTNALAQRQVLLPNPSGSRVLVAKVAITAVTAENKDMQYYEVIPVAAVIATTMAASGNRTQNTVLFFEMNLVDKDTGKTVIAVVRKGYGKTIGDNNDPITVNDVKQAIDDMVKDVVNFPKS
ncbi:DUF3313 domain-containing protein [Biostraticola tofi]|uniref:Uncharacterized protein DUF3313 n=1 Tax=Biostraticola tofi TaxID=466109 RepID=A0A4R3YPI8_9GAMM|nr:DUF3313 domain-containing protein [Biostraticola tofi]TCV94271.1 uncharacterized protein DUF3313 [Biostraticola tofi]